MADLFLSEQGGSLRREAGSLIFEKDERTLLEIGIRELETVHLFGNIQFTTQTLNRLLREGVELALYSSRGRLRGQLTPIHSRNSVRRKRQYQLSENPAFCRDLARELIGWKFRNSLAFLKRYNRSAKKIEPVDLEKMEEFNNRLKEAQELPGVLGLEGSFARLYFRSYQKFLKRPEFFQGREKRPPGDPGNALLSFSYTLVTQKLASLLDGMGFDPYIGFLHQVDYGRLSLAYDLVEPLRALYGDHPVVRWLNLGTFSEQDFEERDGGTYLKKERLKKFLKAHFQETLKTKQAGFCRGNLRDSLRTLGGWLSHCLEEGKVLPLEAEPKVADESVCV